MKRKAMLCGVVLVLGLLALGCGDKSALAGTWYLMQGGGSRIPEKVELLKDGSGFALDQAITWKIENKRLYIVHPQLAMAFNYELSGNDLVLTNDEKQQFVYTNRLGGDPALAGTWFNIGGEIAGDLDLLKDGTGIVNGEQIIWTTKDGNLFIPRLFGRPIPYEVSGSTLIFSIGRPRLIYTNKLGGDSALTGTWLRLEGSKIDRIEFREDGTGIAGGHETVWKTENKRLASPFWPEAVNYDLSGTELTFTNDEGQSLVYNKAGDPALAGGWTDIENNGWAFDSNGELAYTNSRNDIRRYRYIVDGAKLILDMGGSLQTFTISASADGKTVSLTGGRNFRNWRVGGPGWGRNTLTKVPQ